VNRLEHGDNLGVYQVFCDAVTAGWTRSHKALPNVACSVWPNQYAETTSEKTKNAGMLSKLKNIPPGYDPNRRWPINGQAYVAMFMGPISGGLLGGIFTPHWGAVAIGLLTGIGMAFLNGWLIDRFL
jgi:hypothetical protein